jgi:predicted transcriptional regulator
MLRRIPPKNMEILRALPVGLHQREIMYETGLTLQPTQRELNNLLDLGIIKKRETAEKVYYEIDTLSPFFKPLREIFGSVSRLRKK